ncbi:MAG: putative porin [Chitinophagales bacterium]|nr:putative porin [Chitinophagales bacterium]MDW8417948.1 putative porin [Chitinophagales bacterium]
MQKDSARALLRKWKSEHPEYPYDTWCIRSEPEQRYAIDTGLVNLEEYNGIQRPGIEFTNAGNMGTAALPLVFSHPLTCGFRSGFHQFDVYKIHRDSVRYYSVMRPYTELHLLLGLQNEQMLDGRFAAQHKQFLSYGVRLKRYYSRGRYPNQRANDNCFNVYAIYQSPNNRWRLQGDVVFNAFKVRENGGVTADVFDTAIIQPVLAPVAFTFAENVYRETSFYLQTSYALGSKYSVLVNDSTRVPVTLPVWTLSHRVGLERQLALWFDTIPDKVYYDNLFTQNDTLRLDFRLTNFSNALRADFRWRSATVDTVITEKNLIAGAETGFEYFIIRHNRYPHQTPNVYVSMDVRSNAASRSRLIYKAMAKAYLYGWNRGDLLLSATAGYITERWGIVSLHTALTQSEMPYIYERFRSAYVSWTYTLPKSTIFSAGAKYHQAAWGIFAEAFYYRVRNLPVYPGRAEPQVGFTNENFAVFRIGNRHAVKGLHFDNDVWFTQPFDVSSYDILRLYTRLFTRHSLYYENRLFKKALWLMAGVDVRFRYQHNPPYYDPLLAAFYPVSIHSLPIPQLDIFLNVKIKTVRAFAKIDNVVSAILGKGYYALYRYPAQNLSFRVGISWRFYE